MKTTQALVGTEADQLVGSVGDPVGSEDYLSVGSEATTLVADEYGDLSYVDHYGHHNHYDHGDYHTDSNHHHHDYDHYDHHDYHYNQYHDDYHHHHHEQKEGLEGHINLKETGPGSFDFEIEFNDGHHHHDNHHDNDGDFLADAAEVAQSAAQALLGDA